jgi:hypothetical protein
MLDLVNFAKNGQMTLAADGQTVEIALPAGCKLAPSAYNWRPGPGEKIVASFTRDQLLASLAAARWLEPRADQLTLPGLAIYARLRIGEQLIAAATDARRLKFVAHWCQLYADLAVAEPDLIGGGRDDWPTWAQEVTDGQ